MMSKAIQGVSGDSWESMACVDRLVELGEIIEITSNMNVMSQDRIFVLNK